MPELHNNPWMLMSHDSLLQQSANHAGPAGILLVPSPLTIQNQVTDHNRAL